MNGIKFLGAVSAVVVFVSPSVAEVAWETGSYAPAEWTASSNNLLADAKCANDSISYYTENGKAMVNSPSTLADGAVPGASCDYTKICGIAGGNVTWELPNEATLDEVKIFTRWGDGGRDGIAVKQVCVSSDGATWTVVAGDSSTTAAGRASYGLSNNSTSGALYARLYDTDGLSIAANVTHVKIVFSSAQDNGGTGYVEIEACGSALAQPKATLAASATAAWTATLSGKILDLAGDSTADLYFAYGLDSSALTPAKTLEGLALDAQFTFPLEGLVDSTNYVFSYYIQTDKGAVSATKTGSFTTACAQPVELTVTRGYFDRSSAEILYSVDDLGELGTGVDLYFAYGTSDALTPTVFLSSLSTGDAGRIPLTGLAAATTYHYAAYTKNQLGHVSATVTGSFLTNAETDVPKWVGTVSSDWSNPLNWDPQTTFTEGETVAEVVLSAFEGAHEPSNLDIEGLTLTKITFGHGGKSTFAMGGKPVSLKRFAAEKNSSSTLTVENETTFPAGETLGNFDGNTVRFAGIVHGPESGEVSFMTSGNYSHAKFLNPSNDFRGKLIAHVGGITFTTDGTLGARPESDPTEPTVYQNYGSVTIATPESVDYNPLELGSWRYLKNSFLIGEGTELTLSGKIHNALSFTSSGNSGIRRIRLKGTSVSGSTLGDSCVGISGNLIAILDSASFAADATRGFNCASSCCDLNGYSFAGKLTNYGWGSNSPIYVNSDRAHESVLSGAIAPYPNIGTYDVFFGGAGDVRVTCPIEMRTADGRSAQTIRKIGQGMLTLAGGQGNWSGNPLFYGGIALDYSTDGSPKFPASVSGMSVAEGPVVFAGNAAATTSELKSITVDSPGLVEFVTRPGAGGLTLALDKLTAGDRNRAVDFQLGAGTAFTVANLTNETNFGGIWPNFTWNRGETWAYANGDGTIGPMPENLFDATASEANRVWSVGSGDTTLAGGNVYGLRVVADEGDAAVTLSHTLTVLKVGNGGIAGVLISSKSTGNVTISGSRLALQNYNGETAIHNWNTNGIVRISSVLPETNDNNLFVYGPGTTVLDNDSNGYYYGPHCDGGGTLRFTSIADRGTASSLGKGNNGDGAITAGNGTTFEYVGTAAEGHASNRRFNLYGDVTFKANGAGPLTLNADAPFATGYHYTSSRLILAGGVDKAGGVINGEIAVGVCGSVVKRGTGTWTVNSTNSSYNYPTEVEEGTLILNGALTSDVIVRSGATLVLGPNAVIRRSLTLESGATLTVDPTATTAPSVWGHVAMNGTLAFSQRLPQGCEKTILVVQNGLSGSFEEVPSGVRFSPSPSSLVARRSLGVFIILR